MGSDFTLQGRCDHPKAQVLGRTREPIEPKQPDLVDVLHLHCPRCGMLFSRPLWETRRES
jgi:hypothetical protein